jgi:protein-S-isoprenylcysteine O-methyltransferase Ste14
VPLWLRAALFILIAPGTLAGWLPWVIGGSTRANASLVTMGLGGLLLLAGWGVLLWCARDFAVQGKGTPNPSDPPRRLVVVGLYRYVRNPMYVGLIMAVLGHAIVARSSAVVFYAAILAIAFHLRVLMYEEPQLRALFGREYADYCARVNRWLPRPARS